MSFYCFLVLLLIGAWYMFNIKKMDGVIHSAMDKAEKVTQSLPLRVQWVMVITAATVLLIELFADLIREN